MSMSSQVAQPELNATPLIDVLLVLLVMLIFTIPVMTHKVSVTTPVAGRVATPPEIVALDIDFDGAVSWNGEAVAIAALEERLKSARARNPDLRVDVRPDPRAAYEPAAQVLAATQRARIERLTIAQVPDR
ncbi:MAG TPA: biopolymer transporter ExbD [Steroidobacteraceae bacterium]|nr:biopolymer transporter ExbD [Steroidobacteraceae bacterium]